MKKAPKPTESELEILSVLWNEGSATVREIHETISQQRDIGYTTVLKMMQLMYEKGLLTRDESSRAHVYEPAVAETQTQKTMMLDFVDRVFGGSAQKMVMSALESKTTSKEELSEIKRMIETYEEEK